MSTSTLTERVQKVMRKKRWMSAADLAMKIYGHDSAVNRDNAARRVRALRSSGVNIQTRHRNIRGQGVVFQYRRV